MKENQQSQAAKGAGLLGIIGIILLKFKALPLFLLNGLSLVKLGWLFKGAFTLVVSFGVYFALYGWQYAIALIGLIFIHEMGHFIYMKFKGLDPDVPVFVPLVGAYTAMNKMPTDQFTSAMVAIAGPFVGGLGALLCLVIGISLSAKFLIAAAHIGFFLNLIQLVPVKPFDGGFIAESISKWLYIPGVIMLALLALLLQSFLLTIITVIAIFTAIKAFKRPPLLPSVSHFQRIFIGFFYFGLAAALAYLYLSCESANLS